MLGTAGVKEPKENYYKLLLVAGGAGGACKAGAGRDLVPSLPHPNAPHRDCGAQEDLGWGLPPDGVKTTPPVKW